ncbi:MAG: exo-alpha-sialidase, partial [Variovorax sp.]|nr:exo-alpha-sialidase [Variovorax sp.]
MQTLLIATRKGLFVLHGAGTDWTIAAHHFRGEPVTAVLADARDGAWTAALRLGHFGVKLHRSADQGQTWQEVAAPAFPPKPTGVVRQV